MRRPVALRLSAALAAAAIAAVTGVALLPQASAATGGVTGYATQNGGTTGGAGGQTVQASTGTALQRDEARHCARQEEREADSEQGQQPEQARQCDGPAGIIGEPPGQCAVHGDAPSCRP